MPAMLPRLFFRYFRETSFVAEQNNNRAGSLIGFLSDTYPDEAYTHFVGVHPDYRKTGIGRSLYESFFGKIRQKERKVFRTVTMPVNLNSIAFHRRMGFTLNRLQISRALFRYIEITTAQAKIVCCLLRD